MRLQSLKELATMRLVGGTALALHLGHRFSIDIDLFGNANIDEGYLYRALKNDYRISQLKKSEHINIFIINNIKVDIVNYPYDWIAEKIVSDSITMADIPDIAAMKLSAITGRGTKKDFIDIYFLLQHYTLRQMFDFYNKKYPDGSEFLVLRSLAYFDDAEQDESPQMLVKINWNDVRQNIRKEIKAISQSL